MPMSIAKTVFFQNFFAEFITILAAYRQKCYTFIVVNYILQSCGASHRERMVLKMKNSVSSVLKPVLTVLIAVLIPVLMLTGCEKAPADAANDGSESPSSVQTSTAEAPAISAEEFLASDEAAQQVEFIASIVCNKTTDDFSSIINYGTLFDFVFSNVDNIRELGTVRTENGFDYLYLPRAEGARLLYKYFGVTEVSTDCDFYDSKTDCFVFSDAFDRFLWNIHSAEIYSSDDKTVTYKLVYCYPIFDETPEYMTSLLTLNIVPDGESYHLQAASCITSDVEYSTIEEAKAASVYEKKPVKVTFAGRTYTEAGTDSYIDDETGDAYRFYDLCASADKNSPELNAAVIKIIINDYKKPSRYAAVIRQNGEITEWFEITGMEIRQCIEISEKIPPSEMTFDENTRIFTVKTGEHPTYNVLVDFEKQTAKAWFSDIKEEYLTPVGIASADGSYCIYEGNGHGMGDISSYSLYIKNNETGEIRYFRESGGMYGGYSFYGFLKNGDLYYMSSDSLKIYNPETFELLFDIDKNFPLGYSDDGKTCRLLYTFRRDPEKLDFIIVYSEASAAEMDSFGNDDESAFDYRIGFLDKDGNLLKSYDTGKPVLANVFGFADVSTKLEGDSLHLYFTERHSGEKTSGTFSLKTHEYKDD